MSSRQVQFWDTFTTLIASFYHIELIACQLFSVNVVILLLPASYEDALLVRQNILSSKGWFYACASPTVKEFVHVTTHSTPILSEKVLSLTLLESTDISKGSFCEFYMFQFLIHKNINHLEQTSRLVPGPYKKHNFTRNIYSLLVFIK